MIVGDIAPADLRKRLSGPGLRIRTGPVVTQIRSGIPSVWAGIMLHYGAHPVANEREFADFHASVESPRGLRRWWRPQALFRFERDPPFNPLARAQAFPLLEWGLNWCISAHCHQYLILHAAVVEQRGRALILPAPPGSGKSTLCAGLVARGWRLLSDELTLIDIATGNIVPIPRPISLKNASIAAIERFWPDVAMGPIVNDTSKGSIAHARPPAASVRRSRETARPGWIVLPRYAEGSEAALVPVSKPSAFMQLAVNAFNYNLHGRKGFETLVKLIDATSTHEFLYGGELNAAVGLFEQLADAQ